MVNNRRFWNAPKIRMNIHRARHKALLGGPEIYKEGAGEDKGGNQKTWTCWDEFGQCF